MSQIQYTYEIIKVDQESKAMEIVYRSEGRQTMHIGARMPFLGESVESVVKMFAPIAHWETQELSVLDVQVGVSGVISPESQFPIAPEIVLKTFVTAIQTRLDTFANTRNYDGILSACTYATSTVPQFAVEGQYCVQARDATWAAAYQILADVEAGKRETPTSVQELIQELPALQWPDFV